MKEKTSHLPALLITKGIRISEKFKELARSGGAGPSEGITLFINREALNVPCSSWFVKDSPFELVEQNSKYYVKGDGICLEVDVRNSVPAPPEGAGLLHGKNCFGTTLYQNCIHKIRGEGCKFCGIELSWRKGKTALLKNPESVVKALNHYLKYTEIKHITLTTGTLFNREREVELIAETIKNLKKQNLQIHTQLEPKEKGLSENILKIIKESGADTIGIHIETPDIEALKDISPHKYKTGIKAYLLSWERAVKIFGKGQVSTFIIAGIEKNRDRVFKFLPQIASRGVIPYIVPLRPVPGTILEGMRPPDPAYLEELTDAALEEMRQNNLSLHQNVAGCIRCGGCSIMHFRNKEPYFITIAESEYIKNGCFDLRKRVFVEEEGIFDLSDRDEIDARAVHLCALRYGEPIGTVRIYRDSNKWWGGRLAVEKKWRGRLGIDLVKRAVEEMKKRRGKQMYAWVLEGRENFFKKLGWSLESEGKNIGGKLHRLMTYRV